MYRLTRGIHSMPNPDADPQYAGDPEAMHQTVEVGGLVPLNEDQYAAFKDKFVPAESAASDVADADAAQLETAKVTAAVTGQNVNPNTMTNPADQPKAMAPTPRPGVPSR
jgi:hypothetical protein